MTFLFDFSRLTEASTSKPRATSEENAQKESIGSAVQNIICNDSYENESPDDEEDAKDDGSQFGDKVTADNDVKRELSIDYGPTPFSFFYSWFNLVGLDEMVEDTWKSLSTVDSNGENLHSIQIFDIDKILDQGGSREEILSKRYLLLKELNDIICSDSLEAAHKSKVRWVIKGDENTKLFHGILSCKRFELAIRGTIVDGEWIVDPLAVKSMFLKYFSTQFSSPGSPRICFPDQFTNSLSLEQQVYLEQNVSNEEIRSTVWDCGTNKSHGLDDFTFEFFRSYWKLLEHDIMAANKEFCCLKNFSPRM
nr:RNA-directed DNA polymerase, eukaryota, reverse transcriptase zinc-binding domain protein [Tanacetum cinerariifolium]